MILITESLAERMVMAYFSAMYSDSEFEKAEVEVVLEKKEYFSGRILAFHIGTITEDGEKIYTLGLRAIMIDRLTESLQVIGSYEGNLWWCAIKMASSGSSSCFSLFGWIRFCLWNRKFGKKMK